MKKSISNIANKYLQNLSYQIDSKTFELQLITHPEYPSFKSISDTFDYFGIENIAAEVPFEILDELPNSFITLVKLREQQRLYLIKKRNDKILLVDENLETQELTTKYFKTIWSGKIIIIEDQSKQSKFKMYFKFEIIAALILILGLVFFNLDTFSLHYSTYLILSFLGLLISVLIVKESFGIHSKATAKVCEKISKVAGCKGVINSLNSKIFQNFSLSDACIVYYVSNVVAIFVVGFNENLFLLISIISLPIVFFSIYYQGIILKQWCALCLGISSILILQFIVVFDYFELMELNINSILKFLLIFSIVYFAWKNLKILILKDIKLSNIEIEFLKFRRNPELFKLMLEKKALSNQNLISSDLSISFGSNNPSLVITAVTNPLCGYCVESFKVYEKLLNSREDVQLNFVFGISGNIENKETQIIVTVLDIYFNQSKNKAFEALSSWFNNRDLNMWSKKFELKTYINNEFESILQKQKKWMRNNEINFTPVTYIGDYLFPKLYNIEDLIFFIDDLILEKINNL